MVWGFSVPTSSVDVAEIWSTPKLMLKAIVTLL